MKYLLITLSSVFLVCLPAKILTEPAIKSLIAMGDFVFSIVAAYESFAAAGMLILLFVLLLRCSIIMVGLITTEEEQHVLY